jgi:hypothetical protein
VQHHGISRHRQPSSGSTPRDHVTSPQTSSSRSLALDQPRYSALRHSPLAANRSTICRVQHLPLRIRQPLHRRTPRCIGSIQISQPARGAQIPIAPAAPPHVPLRAVSSLGGFRTPTAEYAAPSLKRPASETLHNTGSHPPHSITSSARASSGGGTVRLSALAVLRLMTISNLVGC